MWIPGSPAIFSAGSDPLADAFVQITGTQSASSITIKDGRTRFRVGTADTGSGTVTVNAGATLDINGAQRLNQTAGKVVLNGGMLLQTNPGQAGTFIGSGAGLKGLEINGGGLIAYDDGDGIPDNKVSIFFGVISGTGGTPSNGGAGTLIKTGPDQIGVAGSDQGGGVNSQSLFSFAKLVVAQGGYRGRVIMISGQAQLDERVFGAVPLSVLPDAITLDGGGIGVNMNTVLHPNRGITIGSGGGYFDHGTLAGLTIPGPLSGAGTLTIGDQASTQTANPTFTLSNASNVNTFTGGLVGFRGVLQLNSSLKLAALNDGTTNNASIGIASGQTLTVGTGNGDGQWSAAISGAGRFTKVGGGTQSLSGTPTYAGDTRIQAGTLSIANPYLANGADVYLSTGSTFNLSFAGTDIIRSLYIDDMMQAPGTYGAPGSGAQFTTYLISGTGLLGPTIGVPEPTAFSLALAGLIAIATGVRRNSGSRKPLQTH